MVELTNLIALWDFDVPNFFGSISRKVGASGWFILGNNVVLYPLIITKGATKNKTNPYSGTFIRYTFSAYYR